MSNTMTFETVVIPERIGRVVHCRCGYSWNYFGKNSVFAHCPRCHNTITFNPKKLSSKIIED